MRPLNLAKDILIAILLVAMTFVVGFMLACMTHSLCHAFSIPVGLEI